MRFAIAWLLLVPTAVAQASGPATRPVEDRLFCICDDDCGKVLSNCTCSRSSAYRQEIAGLLAAGLSEEAAAERLIEIYGEPMRAIPRADQAAGIVARLLPWVVLLAGSVFVLGVGRRWRRAIAGPPVGTATPEDEEAVGRELELEER